MGSIRPPENASLSDICIFKKVRYFTKYLRRLECMDLDFSHLSAEKGILNA